MKDKLGGKIMTEFVVLRAKVYVYRKIDKEAEEKRCKDTKKCAVSEGLMFDDYKTCLFDGERCKESKCCLKTRSTWCIRLISTR